MQFLAAVALGVLFVAGALVGLILAIAFVPVALLRAGRPVHKDGIVVRGELVARDEELGLVVAGPAWVRLSGAMGGAESGKSDVLGLALRMRRPGATVSDDPAEGDQDVLFGTFESFHTALADKAKTIASDYLANRYSTVTPWWVRGQGPRTLRLTPDPSTNGRGSAGRGGDDGSSNGARAAAPDATHDGADSSADAAARRGGVSDRRLGASAASGPDASLVEAGASRGEAANRLFHLDEGIAEDRARFIVSVDDGDSSTEIAELRLTERTTLEGHRLRASMFRAGRGLRAVGFRNGIRATLYPLSQLARRVRAR